MRRAGSIALLVVCSACTIDDGPPPPPARPPLGAVLIDRMGRAAVNTALTNGFADNAVKGVSRDEYNSSEADRWPEYAAGIAQSLAIYDALDAVCGNQLLAGPDATPDRYSALANLLADDRLLVNTASGRCQTYFGVELRMADECGGRTLFYDVIDVTYSALAIGAVSGVVDGVDRDEEIASGDVFPFLAGP